MLSFLKLVGLFVLYNIFTATIFQSIFDENDLSDLPKDKYERFVHILYFTSSITTTVGFVDIYPISDKARIIVSFYMMVSFVMFLYIFSHFVR